MPGSISSSQYDPLAALGAAIEKRFDLLETKFTTQETRIMQQIDGLRTLIDVNRTEMATLQAKTLPTDYIPRTEASATMREQEQYRANVQRQLNEQESRLRNLEEDRLKRIEGSNVVQTTGDKRTIDWLWAVLILAGSAVINGGVSYILAHIH